MNERPPPPGGGDAILSRSRYARLRVARPATKRDGGLVTPIAVHANICDELSRVWPRVIECAPVRGSDYGTKREKRTPHGCIIISTRAGGIAALRQRSAAIKLPSYHSPTTWESRVGASGRRSSPLPFEAAVFPRNRCYRFSECRVRGFYASGTRGIGQGVKFF